MLWEFMKWSLDGKSFDQQTNSLNRFFKEMYGDQSGEFVFGYWGLGVKYLKSEKDTQPFEQSLLVRAIIGSPPILRPPTPGQK